MGESGAALLLIAFLSRDPKRLGQSGAEEVHIKPAESGRSKDKQGEGHLTPTAGDANHPPPPAAAAGTSSSRETLAGPTGLAEERTARQVTRLLHAFQRGIGVACTCVWVSARLLVGQGL